MDRLYELLDPTAREMRAQAYPLARAVAAYECGGELPEADFVALSESAAFLAFTTLGGDVDDPAAFDWPGQARALVKVGLTFLRADLGINHKDRVARNTVRRDVSCVAEVGWDAWADAAPPPPAHGEPAGARRGGARPPEMSAFPPDVAFRESLLATLEPLVARELGPRAARVVCDHYFRGVSQRALAEGLAAETGVPMARAERVVNKAVSRARGKLRGALPPVWRALAQEIG
jgi:hypothetical protein